MPTEAKDQRTDAETDEDLADGDHEDPNANDQNNDQPDDDDEDEELDVSNADVQNWLNDVIKTPEIKAVIRQAARDAAKNASDKTTTQVRKELEDKLGKRMESIEKQLKDGSITPDQADAKAKAAADRVARDAQPKGTSLTDADISAIERADRSAIEAADRDRANREEQLRIRELEAYKRELLAGEDRTRLIEDLIVVTPNSTEDDIDEQLERSKELYTTIRKQVTQELRSKGWKSARDLRAADPGPNHEAPEDEEEVAPPTRDRETAGLSAPRKQTLRDRFRYGPKAS